jgi:hypothetical protein
MNVSKLMASLEIIKNDYDSLSILKQLANLQNALQQSIAQPTPATAKVFKDTMEALNNLLASCTSNTARPTFKKAFESLGITEKIGIGLSEYINNAIFRNNLTPADALTEITQVNKDLTAFYATITAVLTNLGTLRFESDKVMDNQSEIGISLPSEVTKSNIKGLEKALHDIDFIFNTIKEVAGDDAASIKIRTIASSELQIFLDSLPVTAIVFAASLERITAFYKQMLEIIKLHKDLAAQSLPPEIVKPLEDHIKVSVKKEVEKIAKDLIDEFYKKPDNARKNELKNQLSKALSKVAGNIDNGAIFEVEVAEPAPPKEPLASTDPNTAEENNRQHKLAIDEYKVAKSKSDELNAQGRILISLPRHESPILCLPNPEDESDEEDAQQQKKRK